MNTLSIPGYGSINSDHIVHDKELGQVSEGDRDMLDKDTPNGNQSLCLSLNFLACLVLGPVNFVVYKIMYDSYGEGRAFFVSQVIICGRESNIDGQMLISRITPPM